jgi:hypothetical protein
MRFVYTEPIGLPGTLPIRGKVPIPLMRMNAHFYAELFAEAGEECETAAREHEEDPLLRLLRNR